MSKWLFPLPLALLGCGNGEVEECTEADGCVETEDTDGFSATVHNVAPYSWSGDHIVIPYNENLVEAEPACENTTECLVELTEPSTLKVDINGDTFICVPQMFTLGENRNGEAVEFSEPWLADGICGLAPEGTYSGWEVSTKIRTVEESEVVWIWIASWGAIVTGSAFFFEDEEYTLEGEITPDLSEISFRRVLATGETEQTIYLE